MPPAQQNEIAALTLLALCGIKPRDKWATAKRNRNSVSKDIMVFIAKQYAVNYAPNTRETVRRQVLHQFVQAQIVDYNPFDPNLPTNSPRTHYAISNEALTVIRAYRKKSWPKAVKEFALKRGSLLEVYARRRKRKLVPVKLPSGKKLSLSPGKHNEVQRAVIEEFIPGDLLLEQSFCTWVIRPGKIFFWIRKGLLLWEFPFQITISCQILFFSMKRKNGCL